MQPAYKLLTKYGPLKRLAYLLHGSVASLHSPSSNIEAWPYGTSLRFASAFRALGVREHSLRRNNKNPTNYDHTYKTGPHLVGRNRLGPHLGVPGVLHR